MIFVDTNVISETMRPAPDARVLGWLVKHDAEIAISTVVIAELAFGISKIHPDQRAARLSSALEQWRLRFSGRLFGLTEEAALAYGELMGGAARQGRPMSAPDGMIAAIALVHDCPLATRNVSDFQTTGIALKNPWAD